MMSTGCSDAEVNVREAKDGEVQDWMVSGEREEERVVGEGWWWRFELLIRSLLKIFRDEASMKFSSV